MILLTGYYRRVNILLFEQQFNSDSNFNISEYLQQDALDYLGKKALIAYLQMLKEGRKKFSNEAESQAILSEYKVENDTVLYFLKENPRILLEDTLTTVVWSVYKEFCLDNDLTHLTKKKFYAELTNKYKFEKKIKDGVTYFYRGRPLDNNISEEKTNDQKQ